MKLEVVVLPVPDVERAKDFYGRLGFDADLPSDNGFRAVQFTPPGSGGSIQFGTNMTSAAPGSAQGPYLIVTAFTSGADPAGAMRRASAAHGEHEKRIGTADPDWPDRYTAYMGAERAGTELPT